MVIQKTVGSTIYQSAPFQSCSAKTALIHEGGSVRPASVHVYTSHMLLATAFLALAFSSNCSTMASHFEAVLEA
jgi:hypothetical protein